MKLAKTQNDQFVFDLDQREKQLLLAVLDRYPLVPPGHQRLSKSVTHRRPDTDQRMLDEALAEQRRENERQLERLLSDQRRWLDTETGCRLTLTSSEIEWLLQVLNDVRVGSWLRLGAPDKNVQDLDLDESTAPHAWTMEVALVFQAAILEGLRGGDAG